MKETKPLLAHGKQAVHIRPVFRQRAAVDRFDHALGTPIFAFDENHKTVADRGIFNQGGIGVHDVDICGGDTGRHIADDVVKRRPLKMLVADQLERGRIVALQPFQGGADPVPAGEVESCLPPTEDPGDGAQISKGLLSGAPGRMRSDSAGLNGVDGRGLSEEGEETLLLLETAVMLQYSCAFGFGRVRCQRRFDTSLDSLEKHTRTQDIRLVTVIRVDTKRGKVPDTFASNSKHHLFWTRRRGLLRPTR